MLTPGHSPPMELDEPDIPKGGLSFKKLFYEEMVFSWITAHPATRSIVYANAWFFFEILVGVVRISVALLIV